MPGLRHQRRAHQVLGSAPDSCAGRLTRRLACPLGEGLTGPGFLQSQRVPLSGSRPAWSSREDRQACVWGSCAGVGDAHGSEGLGSRARRRARAWVPTGGSGALTVLRRRPCVQKVDG